MRPKVLLAVAFGGGIGACVRYGLLLAFAEPTPPAFPTITFAVNLIGSFLLGTLLTLILDVWPPTRYARPFGAIGVLGGFTTFSTFVVEIARLTGTGATPLAMGYLVASLAGGVASCALGVGTAAVATRRTWRGRR